MDFDTNFNAETVKHYLAGLPAVVSPDLLRRNMDFVLTDVGEYMEEWRRYIVLECWTRLENPHEAIFYIAGPPAMIQAVTANVQDKNIEPEKIKIDAWE